MKFKDAEAEAGWNLTVKNNSDPYGKAGVDFARSWADMMEAKVDAGASVADVAQQCSRDAYTEGITGFMYECAVSILSQVWVHGEALRRWHNLDTQIGNEGERANETGGTLNPALLNIG